MINHEDFIADVDVTGHTEACVTQAPTEADLTRLLEALAVMHENSIGLQKAVADSQAFLPAEDHLLLTARCSYLTGLCNNVLAQPGEVKENFDALADIYIGIPHDFMEILNKLRPAES